MSGWELDPDRVRGVLNTVDEHRLALEATLQRTRISAITLDVAGGGWPVVAVPRAVEGLLIDQLDRLARIRGRVEAGLIGTSLAVGAYEAGQEDMCDTFQAQAIACGESGDLTAFAPYLEA